MVGLSSRYSISGGTSPLVISTEVSTANAVEKSDSETAMFVED